MSQGDVVLEALLDEVQNLKNDVSRIWSKVNDLQTRLLEVDSRQRELSAKLEEEIAGGIE